MSVYAEVKSRWTEEERQMLKMLTGMSKDIEELAEQAKEKGVLDTLLFFTKYTDVIDNVFNTLFPNR